MWLIRAALRRPITVLVAALALALASILAVSRMPIDIFPDLNLPVIYVAQPYGGMDPGQMEGYLVYYYEYHFLYITGIEHVESRSIQNVGLVKLTFHPGTDMAQALAQTISYVDRARAFMPPGTVPPFVVRFDAGSVPVGYLLFSSPTRGLGEIQDLALNRVRPMFATLPGVSAPPPFGGNQRTVVVRVDPDRLRAYRMSPDEVVRAIASGNTILPAGNVRIGNLTRITPINSVVTAIQDLASLPLRVGAGPTVFLRDVGTVENGADILTGYAEVDGRRSVYIPVTKRADASTLAVVREVKDNLPRFRALVPEDIAVRFEFDQSTYIRSALTSVLEEGLVGAVLTGLVVLLFLRDRRSALIVVATIPFALLAAVVLLWGAGQTINIMTLGGLALAVGILVDEATVAIENIHTHLGRGAPRARAVLDGSREVIVPRLLAMLSVLAVFVPSFFMTGVARSLFVPLSLAVGFAMLASYFLSSTLVPVLSIWLLAGRGHAETPAEPPALTRARAALDRVLGRLLRLSWSVVLLYGVTSAAAVVLLGAWIGRDIFPAVDTGQILLRFRAPVGTRVEETERMTLRLLDALREAAGPQSIAMTLAYIGTQPPSYPVNTIHLWTSGPHEAVIRAALLPGSGLRVADLQERLRRSLPEAFPDCSFSFEAGDIVSQIMNFGAPTPLEVAISGPSLADDRAYATRLLSLLRGLPALRDLQFGQPLDYPSLSIDIDRERAGQMGVTVEQVGRALVAATASSRFVAPDYWRDPASGIAYQVQVEIPQSRMASIDDVRNVPVMPASAPHPLVGDVAQVSYGTTVGEYDRYNMLRMVTLTANFAGEDLGRAAAQVDDAIGRAGTPPRGVSVAVRGQVAPMRQTLGNLEVGLALAVVVILLLLAANFQSLRLALVVLSAVPAVITGVLAALVLTRTTLNVQSFMGAIMAIGVAVANAILLVTFAEASRRAGMSAAEAARDGAVSRMRPILMTTTAMVAGMIPMALALGRGGEATAPLARAVIGGLIASSLATLTVVPCVFSLAQARAARRSASLDPDDPGSAHASAISAALLLVVAALMPGCAPSRTPASAPPADAGPAPPVDVVAIVEKSLETSARLPGELQAYESVAIDSRVPAFVEWIGVDRGSRVRKGEMIVRLSAPEIVAQRSEAESKAEGARAQRLEAEARLASEEGTYERLKSASATPGVIAQNELDIAGKSVEADQDRVAALRQSEAAAASALASVGEIEGYLKIRAPFDGVVTERNVHPGALVGPAGGTAATIPMVRIETTTKLRLVVPVPETDVSSVPSGSEVKFTVPSFPGEIFSGTVARAAHSLDVKTRTMPVELDVADSSGRLVPGMFPEVQWPVRRDRPTLFVPVTSVARTTEKTFVVRIRDGRAEQVEVRTGATVAGLVEVFGDLRAGDTVAVRGTDELRPGTRVAPKPVPPAAPPKS
jgi:RND family efflux transporter MFP subunit